MRTNIVLDGRLGVEAMCAGGACTRSAAGRRRSRPLRGDPAAVAAGRRKPSGVAHPEGAPRRAADAGRLLPIGRRASAGELYARARWAGLTPRSPHDCLTAATAVAVDVPLLHDRRDFEVLARVERRLRLAQA